LTPLASVMRVKQFVDQRLECSMLRIAGIAVFASLLVGVHAGRVQAHARLTKSVPDAGATLAASPTEIRLQFNEAIEARFSKIAIEAKGGTPIATESVSTDPADKKVLIIKLKAPLGPGAYKVSWRVVSVDTHKINGSFAFQVKS
jgi:copper resistance protein C